MNSPKDCVKSGIFTLYVVFFSISPLSDLHFSAIIPTSQIGSRELAHNVAEEILARIREKSAVEVIKKSAKTAHLASTSARGT